MTLYAQHHIDIWPWTDWKDTTFNPTRTANNASLSMGYLDLDSPSNGGDYISYEVALGTGVWTLTIIVVRASDCGVLTPSIGGVDLSSVDLYSATAHNTILQWNNIGILEPEFSAGVYEINLRTDSKHGSASDYDVMLQMINLTRTSDL